MHQCKKKRTAHNLALRSCFDCVPRLRLRTWATWHGPKYFLHRAELPNRAMDGPLRRGQVGRGTIASRNNTGRRSATGRGGGMRNAWQRSVNFSLSLSETMVFNVHWWTAEDRRREETGLDMPRNVRGIRTMGAAELAHGGTVAPRLVRG